MKNPCGYFDDANWEYVIKRPDTPLPWLNYLGQDDFFGVCTNAGGGYMFWRDAKLRRLTRHRYDNIPMDLGVRYLYIQDGGCVWNPGWNPVKTPLDHLGNVFGGLPSPEAVLKRPQPPVNPISTSKVRVLPHGDADLFCVSPFSSDSP